MSLTFKLKMVFSVLFLFQTCVMAFAAVSKQKHQFQYTSARSTAVTNPVYEPPFTHHQRSLTHRMDSCTTLTVELHHRLQFPSSIAPMTHTADCTDYTADSHHGLTKPWTSSVQYLLKLYQWKEM